MRKHYLFTPGPTPVPEDVLLSMAKPIIHHRTDEFKSIFSGVNKNLQYVFQTENPVLTFASSGTGAMEGTVANLLSRGDKAVVVRGGKFGERWAEICSAYGVEVIPIDIEWGTAVTPEQIKDVLEANPEVKAVFTTLCETSTGVATDIKSIAQIVSKTDAVLVVDAISALGAMELKTDEWRVDVVVSGSQKGLMIPPGLAFCSLSEKAWKLVEKSSLPKYYFDFKKARKSWEKDDSPYTPAVTLIIGLNAALKMIKEEGLENIIARHKKLATATRNAMQALGLELFARSPADVVTAVCSPNGIDGQNLVELLRKKYGISIAGGQARLKGKIFRIAHLGYMNEFDMLMCISAIEKGLHELGYPIEFGKGINAAQQIFTGMEISPSVQ